MPKETFAVWAPCAERHELQPTHARMSAHQFSHFKGALVFWCAGCRTAHLSLASQLTLSSASPAAVSPQPSAEPAASASTFASA